MPSISPCPPATAPGLAQLHALRDAYRQDKAALLATLRAPGASTRGVRSLLHRLSSLTDGLLCRLWDRAQLPEGMALVAVGGYGRAQLFPNSDVDVLLLLPDGMSVAAGHAGAAPCTPIETFIGSCWDAGLEVGSSVRSVAECLSEAAADVTVQTSLLEARLLCGNAALFDTFRQRYDAQMDPRAFLVAKTLEMRQRHTKYENTPYALEPNCKESPGGLRDLQLIQWVARAAGLGRNWRELAASGLATPFEVQQIERNEALLFLIRARLHALAGRREDRLVFDLQTAVAETFGYRSTAPDGQRLAMRASETLMRRYYWAAKAVSQLCQILLLGIEERLNPSTHELRPINPRFFEKAGMIEVASDDLYEREPHAVLETFLLYETTVGLKDLSARTLRALYNARGVMDSEFRRDPANRALFMQILQQPAGITHA
ncbi:MAG: bifunctional uridylyltransferase/uridylyl-removing protein, partial [Diaphorobacter nitroreducens]